jgi:Family of unknown function (DUF5681)
MAPNRWQKGQSGGGHLAPARRPAKTLEDVLRKTLNAKGGKHRKAVIEALVKKASEGNINAAKLVLEYSVGKPTPPAPKPPQEPELTRDQVQERLKAVVTPELLATLESLLKPVVQ